MKTPKILANCLECAGNFYTYSAWIVRGEGKFCSRRCSGAYRSKHFRHSEDAKKRISSSGLGKKRSPEVGQKISAALIGRKVSLDSRRKMSQARIGRFVGELHPNWQGGITPIHQKIRNSREYSLWRSEVFERDNYTCVICGVSKSGKLNADHIKPFAIYPQLRLELSNGRTVCIDCHHKTDTWGGRTSKLKKQMV